MRLFRNAVRVLLLLATVVSFASHAALAASVDGNEAATDPLGTESSTSAPATDVTGPPHSKGGVSAAVGCGFAVGSLILMPNPVSAFLVGFNCMLMLIDAGVTPDR